MTGTFAAVIVVFGVLMLTFIGVALYIYFGRLVMRSRVAGRPVGFGHMVRMTMSGLDAQAVVIAYLDACKAGVEVAIEELEALARAKGDPRRAVKRLIAAKAEGKNLSVDEACRLV